MKHYNISRFLSALMISALLMGQTVYAGDTAFKTYDGFLPSGGASTTDLYEDETGKKETGETTTRPGEAESEEESETKRQTESESVTDSESESESESETETEIVIDPEEEPEEPEEIIIVPEFLTQAEFEAVSERIRIATDVPIEGLPSYITQEMVSAALETAEETGCPASVTLAQLILESENEEGSGMRSMAATYCNLFGIHGLGSNGYAGGAGISVADSYNAFPKNASYAAYYTYTEAYHARNEILKGQVYQEISAADVRDYAVYFGRQ